MSVQRLAVGLALAAAGLLACQRDDSDEKGSSGGVPQGKPPAPKKPTAFVGDLAELVFEPSPLTPERRVYQRGLGVPFDPNVIDGLDKQELVALVKEALAIPAPSCQERKFTDFWLGKYRALAARHPEVKIEVKEDGLLAKFKSLPPDQQKKLSCEDGEVPPNSGNLIVTIAPNTKGLPPDTTVPSFNIGGHLDRRPDPDLRFEERNGVIYNVGKENDCLGADDAAGMAEKFMGIRAYLESGRPHGGFTIVGLVAEEDTNVGAELLDNQYKTGDVGLEVDSDGTWEVNNAGPDIYFGGYTLDAPKVNFVPLLPEGWSGEDWFAVVIEGASQHPASAQRAINSTAIAIQVLKELGVDADGNVPGFKDLQAHFRIESGLLKEGSDLSHPAIDQNGNKVPKLTRLDFRVYAKSPTDINTFRRKVEEAVKKHAAYASKNNKGGEKASFELLGGEDAKYQIGFGKLGDLGPSPTPRNATAILAEALVEMDIRHNNELAGDPEVRFQVNEILSPEFAYEHAQGGWQIRSGNLAKTEPARKKWEKTLARIAKKYRAKVKTDLATGKKLMSGYQLAENDPSVAVTLGAYQAVGVPRPALVPTFGGSRVNKLVAERGSMVLFPRAGDFTHTDRERWDTNDGFRALQLFTGALMFASQYGRSNAAPQPYDRGSDKPGLGK